jgi:DNA-binding Lrp family transcriptional regulator
VRNFITQQQIIDSVEAYKEEKSYRKAAKKLGLAMSTVQAHVKKAAEKGFFGTEPVIPTFRISQITTGRDGKPVAIQQKPERGEVFEVPPGHVIKGVSALVNESGQEIVKWIKTKEDAYRAEEIIKTVVDELKKEIVPVKSIKCPDYVEENLCSTYIITDLHLGMLAWSQETGNDDYDLKIAEELLLKWFSAAIAQSPASHTAIFAQLGDYMHHDSMDSVTPEHRHVLDADSRLQKIIRVSIRVSRQIVSMLLAKHKKVHILMASANHDPASSAWMRELLTALYDKEPRVTVDNSPDIYYSYEFGSNALFFHHGHKRGIDKIDTVFAGKFKELYGKSKRSYAHIGHFHSDGVNETNLMRVERHRTLAAPDAYSSGLGHVSGRDAKTIVYHKSYGEVSRLTISPEMVMDP